MGRTLPVWHIMPLTPNHFLFVNSFQSIPNSIQSLSKRRTTSEMGRR